MIRLRFLKAIFGIAVIAATLELSVSAVMADLVPHRAVYSLKLGKADTSGRFISVDGAVRTMVEKTCDAWITSEQIVMRVETQVGGQLLQSLKYTGWESLDGKLYRFAAHSRTNDEKTSYKGYARSNPKSAGEAVYSLPKKMTQKLPPDTHFYFGLTSWLIEQAKAGASRAETVVFDGTDEEGPQRAVAFIVPLEENSDKFNKVLGPLLKRPGWTISLAFYPMDSRSATPDYEVRAVVLDNGVTPKLELVFTDFTAIQKLEKIEALDPPNC